MSRDLENLHCKDQTETLQRRASQYTLEGVELSGLCSVERRNSFQIIPLYQSLTADWDLRYR